MTGPGVGEQKEALQAANTWSLSVCRAVAWAGSLAACLTTCNDEIEGPAAIELLALSARSVYTGTGIAILTAFAPGDDERIFVVEQEGIVRIVSGGQVLPEPFLDLTAVVSPVADQGRGLLSLAFHPDFRMNGEFFVSYTVQHPETGQTISRVDRLRVSPDRNRADPDSRTPVLQVPQSLGDHNGGHIFFGPDGMMYVAFGDGGSGFARGEAKNRANLLGTILRIDVTGVSPYRIPTDNPFTDEPAVRPEILIWGVRNPWRLSFDSETGDLWIGDVGEARWEEVTVVRGNELRRADLNRGWPTMEGHECFEDPSCVPAEYILPAIVYSHDEGCVVIGGHVYRGSELPELSGRYLFADYCAGWIRAASASEPGGAGRRIEVDLNEEHPISFGVNNSGELYLSTIEGSVFRLERKSTSH